MKATIVTALYDIGREKIDGRGMDQYYKWFEKTLHIQCPMVIFCEQKHVKFIEDNRPKNLQTKIVVQELEEIPYYYLKPRMDQILQDPEYLSRIKDPERIECKTSLYSIIQYSKFPWVLEASQKNYFGSEYFFWLDAGASRFVPDIDVSLASFPGKSFMDQIKNFPGMTLYQMYLLPYPDLSLHSGPFPSEYLYDNRSFVWGGMFGADSKSILDLNENIKQVLTEFMLDNKILNNEQIAIGFLLKMKKEKFLILQNDSRIHRNFELIYQAFN